MAAHQINFLVFLALFSCFAYSSYSYQFVVGGKNGWVVNPSENYNQWSSRMRFQVNDTLLFKYKSGADSVLVVNKDDYDKCNTANPSLKLDDGNSVFKLDRSGPFYFISGNKPNCDQGQKLVVVVLAIRTPPTSTPQVPSPTASPPKGSSSSPSPPSPTTGAPAPSNSPSSPTTPSGGAPAPSNSPTSPTTPSGGTPSPATSPSSPSPAGGALSPSGSGPSPAGDLPGSPSSSTTPGSGAPGSSTPGVGAPGSSTPGIGAPGSSTPGSGTPADGGNGSPPPPRSLAAAPCSTSVFLASLVGLGVFVFSP